MRSSIAIVLPANPVGEALAIQHVLGVPLFLRSVLTLADAGQTDFIVLAPEQTHRELLHLWQQYAAPRQLRVRMLAYDHNQLLAPAQAAFADCAAPRCVLLSATTVVTPRWVTDIFEPAVQQGEALDQGGLLWSDTRPLSQLGDALAQLANQGFTAIRRRYCHVTALEQTASLEHFLCEEIRMNANGLVARHINKRISLPISRLLSRTRIHPHAITVCNMIIGLCSGIGTAGVLYISLFNGALLFQIASIVDGCDGEVAKLTHRTSYFGQFIDTLSDNAATFSFFTGLMIHQYRVSDQTTAFAWGGAMIGGLVTLIVMMLNFQLRYTKSLSFVTFDREYLQPLLRRNNNVASTAIRTFLPLFKKEWYSMLFLVFGMLGILPAILYISTGLLWTGIGLILWLGRDAKRATVLAGEKAHGTSIAR